MPGRGFAQYAFFSFGALLAALAGCGEGEGIKGEEIDPAAIPVPPPNGPKLVVVADRTVVYAAPADQAAPLGTLRAGARLARSESPVAQKGCEGGWYAVRPRGFVCAAGVSPDGNHPAAVILPPAPALDQPLPYRYGRARRGAAVVYRSVPTPAEQLAAEPKLRGRKKPAGERRLGSGANDVPLDDSYLPTGPPVILPTAAGVGPKGYRTRGRYFVFPDEPAAGAISAGATLSSGAAGAEGAGTGATSVLRRLSGVALIRSFIAGQGAHARRFGVMPDGRFVPTDRLEPELATAWHGVSLAKKGLPLAFMLRPGVRPRLLSGNDVRVLTDEYAPEQPVFLTGRFRTVSQRRYYATHDGRWLRHQDIILLFERHKFPDWAKGVRKWLDISLANQYLVAYVGRKPVYATLISSGRERLGDPDKGASTPQGVFKVVHKHVTRDVDGQEVGRRYRVLEAPWVLELDQGFAIAGGYWLSRLGEARGFHDIALAPIDAHWLFHWAGPELPEGWHSIRAGADDSPTMVYVHR